MAITSDLAKSYDFSQSPRFQQKIAVAMLDQVATVAAEAGATTNHANRLAFAAQVALNPFRWASIVAFGCIVVNANIQAAITAANGVAPAPADVDIKAAVTTVWNFYSDASVALTGTVGNKVL